MPDDREKPPPSKADQYRKRAQQIGRKLKGRLTSADRGRLAKKKRALEDMAATEDWLDGKPGSQLKS